MRKHQPCEELGEQNVQRHWRGEKLKMEGELREEEGRVVFS